MGFLDKQGAGGLISGVGGFLSTALTNHANRKAQKRQHSMNLDLMAQQQKNQLELNQDSYNKQVDFWNMQNEYNTPANQRRLAEEAGYNILDVLRNGGSVSTAGQLSSVASGSAGLGSVGLPQSANYAESIQKIASATGSLAGASLDRKKAETEGAQQTYISKLSSLTDAQIVGQKTANETSEFNLAFAEATFDTDIKTREQALRNMVATYKSIAVGTAQALNEYGREPLIRANLLKDLAIGQGQLMLMNWQTEMIRSNIHVNGAQIQSLFADAYESYSRAGLNQANTDTERWKLNEGYYEAEKLVNRWQAKKLKREFHWMPIMNLSKFGLERAQSFNQTMQGASSFISALEKIIFMRFGKKGVTSFIRANKNGEFMGATDVTHTEFYNY